MFKHFPKLLLAIALVLGLYYLSGAFSLKAKTNTLNNPASSEKAGAVKMQTGFDIRNLSHHLLDF